MNRAIPTCSLNSSERPLPSADGSRERAISRILRALTSRKRNQVWGAAAILDELDALGKRITAAAR